MITPFPAQRQQRAGSSEDSLALHSAETVMEHKEGLPWVRWLFQSVRAQRDALMFRTGSVERAVLIADWQGFAEEIFLPVIAPVLLQSWKAASENDDGKLCLLDSELSRKISADVGARSLAAGALLLEQTRGAKYQGALGRYRQSFENGGTAGHLAIVWSAVAALFQLPPLDLLTEYLHEEWLVGAGLRWHDHAPGGALCFAGIAQRALHHSDVGFTNRSAEFHSASNSVE